MKVFQNILRLGLLALLLVLVSCPVPTQSENEGGSSSAQDEDEILLIVDELSYNYALLRYYYFYAQKELRPYADYQGRGKAIPYGDVLAMYADISDPWTRYWIPSEAQIIMNQITTSGDRQGYIGIEMRVEPVSDAEKPDKLYVNRLWIDGPAEKSGRLFKDDRIVGVNGVDLDVDPLLKGDVLLTKFREAASGNTITLTVLRGQGAERISLSPIQKKTMYPPTVYLDYIDEIPVIQITEFSQESGDRNTTAGEFNAALARIHNTGNTPVGIIDLRGNPGGSLAQCFAVIEALVAEGVFIRYEDHYYDGQLQAPVVDEIQKTAKPGGLGESIRWVFLADSNSASAAEILLYALKNCRAETYIVGTTTYGKGVGQYYMWTYSSGLAGITALKFFDKDLNSYHGIGIHPDMEESDSAAALQKAVDYALSVKQGRSVLGAAPADSAAIFALNNRLIKRQVPADENRGGAWQLLPPNGSR